MPELPCGTVTFLFTDIEGSTALWDTHADAMRLALARHDQLLRQAIAQQNGVVFKTMGDAFCAAFHTAPEALHAALAAQLALHAEAWPTPVVVRVRMALHTGTAEARDNDYFGPPLNRVARLLTAGHGGQTLLSDVASDLCADTLPQGVTLHSLGTHNLRDLGRPETIFQLLHAALPADFAPLKTLDNLPNNLPQQLTSFIGREKEMADVKSLLARTRLLTLVGSGGSGKTRLSLQTGADTLEQFPDGVWLVELAPLADPTLLAATVASVLSVKEETSRPILATLVENLKTKKLLLLLDNCEHVLDAGAKLADTLIRNCPNVKVLATSREGLGIAGETTYRVPSLSLPDPRQTQTAQSLSQFEAVRLFVDRALQTRPDFAVTNQNAPALASICFRLDGIPPAIELAAARARSLSVEDIHSKLDQRFRLLTGGSRTALPRQQTLRSLIDWSYDLLNEPEKALLCRLSVFAGGWTLDAAEQVCAGGAVEEWETLDLLTSLCDKSLVVAEPSGTTTRYRMLETVRQYARDRLLEVGDGAVYRDKHLAYFLALAEELVPQIKSPRLKVVLSLLKAETDNCRAALEWCGDSPERAEVGLRLTLVVWRGIQSDTFKESWDRLTRALEAAGDADPILRARGWLDLGIVATILQDYAAAQGFLEQSLALWQDTDDRSGLAQTLNALGTLATHQKDNPLARRRYEECLAMWRVLANWKSVASALNNLGNVAYHQGDFAAARSFYEESLQINREEGNQFGMFYQLLNYGNMQIDAGDYAAAESMLRECLAIVVENDMENAVPWALEPLGGLLAVTDSALNAARLWGMAERQREILGEPLPVQDREQLEARIAAARAALHDDTAFDAAWQEGRALSVEQAVALAQRETTQTHASP